jgi:hypothetical protein
MGRRLGVVAIVAGLLCAGSASAGRPSAWRTYQSASGFRIAVPATWLLVPQSADKLKALITHLQKSGQLGKARLLRSYASDKYQHPLDRVFDAVQWPELPGPIATDAIVTKRSLSGLKPTPSTLRAVANYVASQLGRDPGVTLGSKRAQAVRLAGGLSYLIYGTATASGFGGERTGFANYLLIGHGAIWEIEFRTNSRYLGRLAQLFRRIAGTFRIS